MLVGGTSQRFSVSEHFGLATSCTNSRKLQPCRNTTRVCNSRLNMSIRPSAKPQVSSWGAGYEKRDISVGWLAGILAFMGLAALTIHLVLAGLVNTMKAHNAPV